MKTIIVKSQAEIDALPDSFDEYTIVEIRSSGWVILKKRWENSSAVLRENSSAVLRENSSAVLRENSSAVLWENSSAELWGNSSAVLWENSSAVLWENSSAELWGNSSAVLWENSSAELWGNSSAELWGNSSSRIWSSDVKIASAKDQAILIFENGLKPKKISGQSKGVQIIKRKTLPPTKHTLKTFKESFPKNVDGDHMILFKSVHPKTGCDFQTGTIKYDGVVECHDFDPNPERQCGGGLHLSPTKGQALSYNMGRLLKCRVKLEDMVVYPGNITKVRCRRVEVIGAA